MLIHLTEHQKRIIKYCAKVRSVDKSVIPNADMVRLIDDLAMAAGISDKRYECQDCRYWKFLYACSGMKEGRGRCAFHTYEKSEYGQWQSKVVVGGEPNRLGGHSEQESAEIWTLGEFSCASFLPTKQADDPEAE